MTAAATLAVPGDVNALTGGYAYARALLAAAPGAGLALDLLALPDGFPFPSPQAVETALARLAAAPAHRPLLVDGLALGALPAAGLARLRAPLAGLLHHPLALEAGLDSATAARLEASERAALAQARAVVTTSRATARTAVALFGLDPARVSVAPPGLDRGPVAALAGDPPAILCVGSLTPRKAQHVLVDALARIAERRWRATLAGLADRDPAYAAEVAGAIRATGLEGRVTLAGGLDRAALDAAYAGADLFCLPSTYEGYGMVYAEAMVRGLPVVAARHAASEEVVGAAGLLTPPGDAAALAGALAGLLDAPERRRALAAAGRARAEAFPDWDVTARRVAAALAPLSP
jgi:glycosyltransferase involved in cell wall biosynthesis